MIRDWNLIKAILEYVEEHGRGVPLMHPDVEGYDDLDVEYHVKILAQGRVIDTAKSGHPTGLTWMGHNHLEALRAGNVPSAEQTPETGTKKE